MKISTALSSVVSLLHEKTAQVVHLGSPAESSAALYVWPWQLAEAIDARNMPPVREPGGERADPSPSVEVRFLLMPGTGPNQLDTLAHAHHTLSQSPILLVEGVEARIVHAPLTIEQLASLFSAAALKLRLSANFVLRCPM
jgi:hypothetical protein